MKPKTESVLMVMNVLAWVAAIGLLIKAGAIIFSYVVSTVNPAAAGNLYEMMDFSALREYSFWYYTTTVSLMVGLLLLEAGVAFLVIRTLSEIKMANPFTASVAKKLEGISYGIIAAWGVALVYNAQLKWLSKRVDGILDERVSDEFILLAGVVFIFAQIFKKGVALQTENELTV